MIQRDRRSYSLSIISSGQLSFDLIIALSFINVVNQTWIGVRMQDRRVSDNKLYSSAVTL